MSSCWAKDDTRDTKRGQRQTVKGAGGTINLAGNRATQQITRDCNTVSNSRWGFQLERQPVLRFGGCLDFLIRPGCCCYASFNADLLSLPPGPWAQRRLKLLRSLYLKRSLFCCMILLRSESALHVLLCRFLNTSEPLAPFLRCRHPLFRFGGHVEHRYHVDRVPTIHPVLFLSSRVTLSPIHLPKHESLPIRSTNPANSFLRFRTAVSTSAQPVFASAFAQDSTW